MIQYLKHHQKIFFVVSISWTLLLLIDVLSFPLFENINFFNLTLELTLSILSLYPLFILQKFTQLGFYKILTLGFFLLSMSYFVDAIDQIFIHTIFYTVVMEKITLFIAVILIFIGSKRWMADFEELSLTDDLTKLPNRKLINQLVNKEITFCNKNSSIFCLAIIDIDYFKNINDQYGHNIGDSVLTLFANLLSELKDPLDIVGRWGGEEFVIIVKNVSKEEALIKLNRVRVKISHHLFEVDQKQMYLTASFGICQYNYPQYNFKKLFIDADKALYLAKDSGRNKVM
jgi:diguanylate cyclase (GGDEF)-like protein